MSKDQFPKAHKSREVARESLLALPHVEAVRWTDGCATGLVNCINFCIRHGKLTEDEGFQLLKVLSYKLCVDMDSAEELLHQVMVADALNPEEEGTP